MKVEGISLGILTDGGGHGLRDLGDHGIVVHHPDYLIPAANRLNDAGFDLGGAWVDFGEEHLKTRPPIRFFVEGEMAVVSPHGADLLTATLRTPPRWRMA